MSYHLRNLVSDDVISHYFPSHLVSPLVSSQCLSSIHLMSCVSHHLSSLLISSHLITPINRIPFHLIASYHILSSQTSSTIIFLHPPGPQVPHTIFVRFNATVLSNEHQTSINQGVNQRPEVLWIRTGFDLRQTWAIALTYQLFETVGLHCQLECKAILDPHNQTVGTSENHWKSCIKLHRLHRLHRLNTFTFMFAMSAHCPKRLQHIWMSLDFSLGRLGDTILDVQ